MGWCQYCENVTPWAINKEVWVWFWKPFCCVLLHSSFLLFFLTFTFSDCTVSIIIQKYLICILKSTAFLFTFMLLHTSLRTHTYNPNTSWIHQFVFYFLRLCTVLSIVLSINTSFDTLIKQNKPLWRRSFPLKQEIKCLSEDYILPSHSRRERLVWKKSVIFM